MSRQGPTSSVDCFYIPPGVGIFKGLFTEPCSFNSLIREVVILLHSTFRSTSLGVKTLTRTSSLRWYPTES
ncbi:hypothetical protein ACN38_g11152 [Penicillium nordicum]|uniref:Uncharacterized protein n=1 Tax=Penicillium nordicum TaxID=229535 RepID=A0A0M8NRN5_9EURO|nr:hypothetical protein ACN38_g11152 [Penicillium nordicum]